MSKLQTTLTLPSSVRRRRRRSGQGRIRERPPPRGGRAGRPHRGREAVRNKGDLSKGPRHLNLNLVAADCEWGSFGQWSACSRSCGSGAQSRFRAIRRQATRGGRRCLGSREESRLCNTEPCGGSRTATTRRPQTTTRRSSRPEPTRNTTSISAR